MRTLTSERALLHNRNLLIKTWAVRLALSYTLSLIETRRDLFFASHWHWNRVFFFFSLASARRLEDVHFFYFSSAFERFRNWDGNGTLIRGAIEMLHWLQPRQSSPENRFHVTKVDVDETMFVDILSRVVLIVDGDADVFDTERFN